ncbi:unnamed protein product, partial [Ectocarpus sp. 4 AP-2014]
RAEPRGDVGPDVLEYVKGVVHRQSSLNFITTVSRAEKRSTTRGVAGGRLKRGCEGETEAAPAEPDAVPAELEPLRRCAVRGRAEEEAGATRILSGARMGSDGHWRCGMKRMTYTQRRGAEGDKMIPVPSDGRGGEDSCQHVSTGSSHTFLQAIARSVKKLPEDQVFGRWYNSKGQVELLG